MAFQLLHSDALAALARTARRLGNDENGGRRRRASNQQEGSGRDV